MTTPAQAEWPEIQPFEVEEAPIPFPTDELPAWAAHFIRAESNSSQVPEDLTGMLTLAAISAAIQGRVNVLANNGAWTEPITLYVATVMEPGERKSAIFDAVTRPLFDWQESVREIELPLLSENQQKAKEYENYIESADRQVDKINTALIKAQQDENTSEDFIRGLQGDLDNARRQAVEYRILRQQHEEMFKFRLLFDDMTPEAANQNLSQQKGECIAIMADEGGVFDVLSGGRYNDRMNLDTFLKGHSGGHIIVDRVGREHESVKRAMITLGLAIQPSVLYQIGESDKMRGRGLLGRFAYSIPTSIVGNRLIAPESVSPTIQSGYDNAIREIAQHFYATQGLVNIPLSDEADEIFQQFQTELEPRLRKDRADLSRIPEWSGKLAGLILRIASIIQIGENRAAPTEISGDAINRALHFLDYLTQHAIKAHDMMGLLSGKMPEISMREIMSIEAEKLGAKALKAMLPSARNMANDMFEVVLEDLEARGFVKGKANMEKGGRVTKIYYLNPALRAN